MLWPRFGNVLILIGLIGAGLWLHRYTAVRSQAVISMPPTLSQLQAIARVSVYEVDVQQLTWARIEGYTGGNRLQLIVHGQVDLGVDATQLKILHIDHQDQILTLNRPQVVAHRVQIDPQQTQVYHMGRSGLWLIIPGPAHEDRLMLMAIELAQQQIIERMAQEIHLQEQAVYRFHQLLNDALQPLGWRVLIQPTAESPNNQSSNTQTPRNRGPPAPGTPGIPGSRK